MKKILILTCILTLSGCGSPEDTLYQQRDTSGDYMRNPPPEELTEAEPPQNLALPFNIEDVGGNEFLSPFGPIRRPEDKHFGHGGIDIPLVQDASILAVGNGVIQKIEKATDGRGGFNILLMLNRHRGTGWGFLYEHVIPMKGIGEGVEVTKGQIIALNGLNTIYAKSYAAHVHV